MVWSAINHSYDLTVSKIAHCSLLWNNFDIFLRHKYTRVVVLELLPLIHPHGPFETVVLVSQADVQNADQPTSAEQF